jgi:threonine dehydratase
VGLALRGHAAGVRLIGVEAEASTAFTASLREGRITRIQPKPTLADGLAGNLDPDSITFPLMQEVCDRVALVSEKQLRQAIAGLAGEEHVIAEGAGGASTAALLGGQLGAERGPVVAIVSGANIDLATLRSVLSGRGE